MSGLPMASRSRPPELEDGISQSRPKTPTLVGNWTDDEESPADVKKAVEEELDTKKIPSPKSRRGFMNMPRPGLTRMSTLGAALTSNKTLYSNPYETKNTEPSEDENAVVPANGILDLRGKSAKIADSSSEHNKSPDALSEEGDDGSVDSQSMRDSKFRFFKRMWRRATKRCRGTNVGRYRDISKDPEMNMFLKGFATAKQGDKIRAGSGTQDARTKELLDEAMDNYYVLPDHPYYMAWTVVTAFFIVFYLFVVPVRIGFSKWTPTNDFVQGQGGWLVFDLCADGIFILDLVLNFRTVVKLPGGEYLTDYLSIGYNYVFVSKWFWPDLIASVPVSLILQDGSEGVGSINKVLRLVRIFKLFRVFRMARFLKNLEEMAIVNPSSIRLMGLVVSYFYLLHLFACIYWFFLTSKGGDDGRGLCDPDVVPEGCGEGWKMPVSRICQPNQIKSHPNGARCEGLKFESLNYQYAFAFYFSVSATAGVGYDIEPTNITEHLFTTVVIIVGVVIMALLIGSVPGAIENLDHYNQARKREIDNMNDYMRKHAIPLYLRQSVQAFFEYSANFSGDLNVGPDSVEDLMQKRLPKSLYQRIQVANHIRELERIPLFEEQDAICKIAIIEKLHPRIATPGEYLIVQDFVTTSMFIIRQGVVEIRRKRNAKNLWSSAKKGGLLKNLRSLKEKKPPAEVEKSASARKSKFATMKASAAENPTVGKLSSGDFFGENALLERPHDTSAIAVEYCDLMQLSCTSIQEICQDFPELHDKIVETAKERYEKHVPEDERSDAMADLFQMKTSKGNLLASIKKNTSIEEEDEEDDDRTRETIP